VKRPAFQFYPADWRKDVELRSCSVAARGLWIDVLCIAHECEPYGHLTVNGKAMNAAQLAGQVGLTKAQCAALLQELTDNGVARTTPEGVIYSKRMVEDEDLRNRRAEGGKAGSEHGIKGAEHGIKGGRPANGRGVSEPPLPVPLEPPPSSSSSFSASAETQSLLPQAPAFPAENRPADPPQLSLVEAPKPKARTVPDCPHQAVLALWAEVLPAMPQHNARMWGGTRADHLRARWRETAVAEKWETETDGLAYMRRLFGYVGRSAFLTGRSKGGGDRPPFVAELAWVVNPQNWAKVHEGKYHTDAA
jgi:hypothetical protein